MLPTDILGTNNTIYREALPILYKNNTFHHCTTGRPEIHSDLTTTFVEEESLPVPKRLSMPPNLSLLRYISFSYFAGYSVGATWLAAKPINELSFQEVESHIGDFLSTLLSLAPNIKVLNLSLQVDWDWKVPYPGPAYSGPHLCKGDTADILRNFSQNG